jgi:nucleotide-binding universal stress UspA family protein
VVCFAVRPLTALVDPTGEHAERHVVGEWWTQLEDDVASILTSARRSPATSAVSAAVTTRVEMVLGEGGTWSDALHDVSWGAGELLIVGTSSGPMSRIFLGSHANKIVRNSPVPVMLLPRN